MAKTFIPLQLTQRVDDGEEQPPDLGWKDLGALRVLDVAHDARGTVRMKLGCRNTRVTLVASNKGGIRVYRNNTELVECT